MLDKPKDFDKAVEDFIDFEKRLYYKKYTDILEAMKNNEIKVMKKEIITAPKVIALLEAMENISKQLLREIKIAWSIENGYELDEDLFQSLRE